MTIILAFDISSVSTGYCVFKENTISSSGIIKMNHKTHGERLAFFESTIINLLQSAEPTDIYIEDIWHGLNIKTYKILSYYHGIIHKLCFSYFNKEPSILAPSEVRKIIGDKFGVKLHTSKKEKLLTGLDSKHLTFDFIISHFNILNFNFKTNNDETDGIALALAASILLGGNNERSIQSPGSPKKRQRRSNKEGVQKAGDNLAS